MSTEGTNANENAMRTGLRSSSGRSLNFGRIAVVALSLSISFAFQSQVVVASCGDYLQHRQDASVLSGLFSQSASNHSVPTSKCHNGNCGSHDSVPLPTKSQLRIKSDRQEMNLANDILPCLNFHNIQVISDELLLLQPAFDVADPPPRLSV
jgi:hypothetical protein